MCVFCGGVAVIAGVCGFDMVFFLFFVLFYLTSLVGPIPQVLVRVVLLEVTDTVYHWEL